MTRPIRIVTSKVRVKEGERGKDVPMVQRERERSSFPFRFLPRITFVPSSYFSLPVHSSIEDPFDVFLMESNAFSAAIIFLLLFIYNVTTDERSVIVSPLSLIIVFVISIPSSLCKSPSINIAGRCVHAYQTVIFLFFPYSEYSFPVSQRLLSSSIRMWATVRLIHLFFFQYSFSCRKLLSLPNADLSQLQELLEGNCEWKHLNPIYKYFIIQFHHQRSFSQREFVLVPHGHGKMEVKLELVNTHFIHSIHLIIDISLWIRSMLGNNSPIDQCI